MNTVFAINPETNEPYITVDRAMAVITAHIKRHGNNVVGFRGMTLQDTRQRILMRLCSLKYKPEKAAPVTFIITVCMSTLGNLANMATAYDRHKEVLFFTDEQKDIAEKHWESIASLSNPESILSAYQELCASEEGVSYLHDVREKTTKRSK